MDSASTEGRPEQALGLYGMGDERMTLQHWAGQVHNNELHGMV